MIGVPSLLASRRWSGLALACTLVTVTVHDHAATRVLAQTQTATPPAPPGVPWPPPDVHRNGEPGLTPPQSLSSVQPQYTGAAIRARITGHALVLCIVETDGTIKDARIGVSLDRESGLDDAALGAVRQWTFKPAMLNGTPVRMFLTIDLEFKLDGRPAPPLRAPAMPPLTWPAAFPAKSDPIPVADAWPEDVETAEGLQLRIAHPPGWRVVSKGLPTEVVSLGSEDGRALFGVTTPRPAPFDLQHRMPQMELDRFTNAMKSSFSNRPDVRITAAGQAQTRDRFWVWLEVPSTLDAGSLPPGLPPAAVDLFDGSILWNFTTTSANRMLAVTCIVLHARGESAADSERHQREAAAIFAEMLQRLVIQAR